MSTSRRRRAAQEAPLENNAEQAGESAASDSENVQMAEATNEYKREERSHMEGDDKQNNSSNDDILKFLTERILQNDRNNGCGVSVESFAKIIPCFDGVSIPIRQWLNNFNENSEAYELNSKQKYVNARNKMKGAAALFLETITVSNYDSLCVALLNEFEQKLSSAEVHKQLATRKKLISENFHEYVLQMRKIAALGCIEEESVIAYIADGVDIREDRKYPLYSATSYKELIKAYELIMSLNRNLMQNKRRSSANTQAQHDKNSSNADRKPLRCFNCGSTQHKRAECREDTKCFRCNGSGHTSKDCVAVKQSVSVVIDEKRIKQMKINNEILSCLVDTGSDVSLMRKGVFDAKYSRCSLKKSFTRLFGLGNVATVVLGEFNAEVNVDGLHTQHTFLLVPDTTINVGVIVGYDFLKKFSVTLNAGCYTFAQAGEKNDYNVYNVVEHNPEIDVEPKYREAVKKLIDNYKPSNVQSSCPIKLKIVKDDHLVAVAEILKHKQYADYKMKKLIIQVNNKMTSWLEMKKQMQSNEQENVQKLEQCQQQIAALRNENLELKRELTTKVEQITAYDTVRKLEHDERNKIREEARAQIQKAQETYKINYDKKRKGQHGYQLSDLVAIKVTQFVTGKKLTNKYIGPYEVIKVKRNDRYDVKKAAEFQGPQQTSTSADYMKLWRYIEQDEDDIDEESSETDDEQDGRM